MGIVIEIAQSFELAPTKDLPDSTFKNHSFFPILSNDNRSKKSGRVKH